MQFTNEVPEKTATAWEKSKSLASNFFREGENEYEMICQLCPTQKVFRKQKEGTSNLIKHVKRFHFNDLLLVKAESKQPAMEKS